jgi:hypothetical protein
MNRYQEVRIGVGGRAHASCVARVERAIKGLPGVIEAAVDSLPSWRRSSTGPPWPAASASP